VTLTPDEETKRALNHFNLIRMIAAVAVLVSHSHVLATGRDDAEPLRAGLGLSLGSVAVDVFFVCSGFLVTGSLLRQPSLAAFARARALRIYPALLAVVALMVLTGGAFFSRLPLATFVSTSSTWTFVAKNAWMLFGFYPRLPGVFELNPYASTVNGSLWSLPYEIRFYLLLGVLGWLSHRWLPRLDRHRRIRWAAAGLALVALAVIVCLDGRWENLPPVPRFLWMFFAGATAWTLKLNRYAIRWPLLGLLALIASIASGLGVNLVYALAVPVIVLSLAHGTNRRLAAYNRIGDYSYGTYLLAFPIQQALMASFPALTPAGLTAAALPCTILGAVVLWHGVESPALRWKLHWKQPGPVPQRPPGLLAPRDQLAQDLTVDPVA
jgi:peptidoglycan/LPS O-acetylase OafA/YrhL